MKQIKQICLEGDSPTLRETWFPLFLSYTCNTLIVPIYQYIINYL